MRGAEILGYVGAVFSLATCLMRTMVPLRSLAMVGNVISATYGFAEGLYPLIGLHCILFPINGLRLREMLQLVRRVKRARDTEFNMDWLKPFMHRREIKAGETLFKKGEAADAMFLVVSGHCRLAETGINIPPGTMVGEFGLFSPGGIRTQTLTCEESGEMLVIGYQHFKELYFQNPEFGFYFLQLTTGRLFQNIAKLEAELIARGAPEQDLEVNPAPA